MFRKAAAWRQRAAAKRRRKRGAGITACSFSSCPLRCGQPMTFEVAALCGKGSDVASVDGRRALRGKRSRTEVGLYIQRSR